MQMPRFAVGLAALALSGCVAAAERRATNSDAAAGPPPPPRSDHTAGEIVAGSPKAAPDPVPESPPGADYVWVRGAWHWNGARYEWIAAHWQKKGADFTRPYPGEH